MSEPSWREGLVWQCTLCGATYPSEWARNVCTMEDREADRAARRR